jgi:hypothetical protein
MEKYLKFFSRFLMLISVVAVAAVFVAYYSFIFARNVEGVVYGVEKASVPMIVAPGASHDQIFSFAVAIKENGTNEIITASSEDRQWAVVKPGLCVKVKFYPYPPWNLEKGGTYFNARLISSTDCQSGQQGQVQ